MARGMTAIDVAYIEFDIILTAVYGALFVVADRWLAA